MPWRVARLCSFMREHSATGLFLDVSHRYEEDADGVAVHFERREAGDSVAIGAKLLIGADGGFSAVRRQCLGDGLPDWKVCVLQMQMQMITTRRCSKHWAWLSSSKHGGFAHCIWICLLAALLHAAAGHDGGMLKASASAKKGCRCSSYCAFKCCPVLYIYI